MAWVAPLAAGAASGILSYFGGNKQSQAQQAYFNPQNIYNAGMQLNPWLQSALSGANQNSSNPFQQSLNDIAAGRDISPYLLNRPLQTINQGESNNLNQLQGIIGRSGFTGGLANAYALANMSNAQGQRAQLYNQYGQWREQQRRSDLNWLMGLQNQGQQNAMGLAQMRAGYQPQNWMQGLGNAITGGLAGYGAMQNSNNAPMSTYNAARGVGQSPYSGSASTIQTGTNYGVPMGMGPQQ